MRNINSQLLKAKLAVFFVIIPLLFYSQENKTEFISHWYISLNGGTSYSNSDVTKYFDFPEWPAFKNISPGGEIVFGRQITPAFGLNITVYGGLLKGDNLIGEVFESDLFDYSLNGTVNFNKLFGIFENARLNLHAFAGVGQVHFRAKNTDEFGTTVFYGYNDSPEEFRGSGINGRKMELIFPFTLGLDYKLTDKLLINADYKLKITDTDLIDGKPFGAKNDWYNFISVGIRYNFGKTKKIIPEPKIEKPIQKIIEQPKTIVVQPEIIQQPVVEKVEKYVEPKPVYIAPKPVEIKLINEYRVQISACYRQPLKIGDLSKKYNLNPNDIVFGGVHNNYYIYTVGSFATPEEAKRRCQILINNNRVLDAFIVRFENGKRVAF